ncbi:MAG: glycosyltransferase family 9 protein, partial [Bacteroidota bacterium]
YYGFSKVPNLQYDLLKILDPAKKKIILHPKSRGSAKEWGLDNFAELIQHLPSNQFQVFISGTKQDAEQMPEFLANNTSAINITGKLNLAEFIVFIANCDVLVAASTGPLHIAAALNKQSIGLFTSKRPMHPGRWAPLGAKAHYLVFDSECEKCQKGEDCNCIQSISPQKIIELVA